MIHNKDCLEGMKELNPNTIDLILTDPPYGISFMGKNWDHGIPGTPYWEEALRVAKPGAHLMAFGGTRSHHRLMVAIEDAGWEIRDTVNYLHDGSLPESVFFQSLTENQRQAYLNIHHPNGTMGWCFGSGFPKSTNISKQIDKQAGIEPEIVGVLPSSKAKASDSGFMMAQKLDTKPVSDAAKEWYGWGSSLKPAWEPIVLARKPLDGTLAANTLKWGCGGLNIDACRVPYQSKKDYESLVNNYKGGLERATPETQESWKLHDGGWKLGQGITIPGEQKGRFPADLIHDGSQMVLDIFPNAKGMSGGGAKDNVKKEEWTIQPYNRQIVRDEWLRGDDGSAARFFYCAKASKSERNTGCEGLEYKSAGECTDRKEGTAGLNSPRAGAGRTSGSKNTHPCVKPIALMEYLLKLGSRQGATVLDPYMGSGTTGVVCKKLNREFIGYEIETSSFVIAEARIGAA